MKWVCWSRWRVVLTYIGSNNKQMPGLLTQRLSELYWRTARIPPEVLARKAARHLFNKVVDCFEELRGKLRGTQVSDEELCRAVRTEASAPLLAVDVLEAEMGQPLLTRDEVGPLASILEEFPTTRKALLARAERALAGYFDLLGSGPVLLGTTPDWHCDFKSDARWSPTLYFKRAPFFARAGADIKTPWELSRLQHLPAMGYAFLLTGDDRYPGYFQRQVSHWIENNPPSFGVNWACTMDVAMRATSLSWAYSMFRQSSTLSTTFKVAFMKSMLAHGRHILANLENTGIVTANHFLADVSGLAFLAQTFPGFRESTHWLKTSLRHLESEIDRQVYPDGAHFEASTSYHRLAIELLILPGLLNRRNGSSLSPRFWEQLKKMFVFDASIQNRAGQVPQLGDNDSGRGYRLVEREDLDHGYLNTLGATIFGDPQLQFGRPPDAEAALIVGPTAFRRVPQTSGTPPGNCAFRDCGVYVLRSPQMEAFIACGPNGQEGNGGHAHNDKLSFELSVDGLTIVVDPGTGVYTPDPELRNYFRSTGAHSTVVIDGKEQAPLFTTQLFFLPDAAGARMLVFEALDDGAIFSGVLAGAPVRHTRTFRLDHHRLMITDELASAQEMVAHFPLSTGAKVHLVDQTAIARVGSKQLRFVFEADTPTHVEIVSTKYSKAYGIIEPSTSLRVHTTGQRLISSLSLLE